MTEIEELRNIIHSLHNVCTLKSEEVERQQKIIQDLRSHIIEDEQETQRHIRNCLASSNMTIQSQDRLIRELQDKVAKLEEENVSLALQADLWKEEVYIIKAEKNEQIEALTTEVLGCIERIAELREDNKLLRDMHKFH